MTQPVNLNRVRKRKVQDEKKLRATHNAATHGQSKAHKVLHEAQAEKIAKTLDGHRRMP